MARPRRRTSSETGRTGRASLWFGLLGGAFAWLAHFIAAYVVAEFGCVGLSGGHRSGGISLVAWIEIALTVIGAAAAGAATFTAYRCWRRLQAAPTSAEVAERGLARTGFYSSGIFLLAILFESIAILFYWQHC